MKVLVTGGAGFIGLNLANYLSELGHEVHILDKIVSNQHLRGDGFSVCSDIKFIDADLCGSNELSQLSDDFTHVVHLAAQLGVQNVIENSYKVLDENIRMTSVAIKIAKTQTKLKQFVFASTSEVYAGTLTEDLLTIPTAENSILVVPNLSQPRTSYMLSKIYGEAMCQQSGLPWLTIRPHNIYGPRMGFKHVIPQLMHKIVTSENGMLEVFSCDHSRTFCFVDDAVDMIVSLMADKRNLSGTFNIGNEGPEISIRSLAKEIMRIIGKDLIIKPMPATDGSPKRRAPAMRCFKDLSSAGGRFDLSSGIEKTYQWYKKTYGW
jgi:nucleoside-diphosphate-sugar epimerase